MTNKEWDEDLKGKINEVLIAISYCGTKGLKEWKTKETMVAQIFGFTERDRKHQQSEMLKRLPSVDKIWGIIFSKKNDTFMKIAVAIHDLVEKKLKGE